MINPGGDKVLHPVDIILENKQTRVPEDLAVGQGIGTTDISCYSSNSLSSPEQARLEAASHRTTAGSDGRSFDAKSFLDINPDE